MKVCSSAAIMDSELNVQYIPDFYDIKAANSLLSGLLDYKYRPLKFVSAERILDLAERSLTSGETGLSYTFPERTFLYYVGHLPYSVLRRTWKF